MVFGLNEGLNLLEDARINDKTFFSDMEKNCFEEIVNNLKHRLKEMKIYLDTFEQICDYI